MKVSDILEYKTRHGKEIKFKKTLDSEKENRGFIVHRLDAYVDGIHAGYLKISYIPKELFKKFNPTVFHWMDNFGGRTLIPFDNELAHYTEFDRKEKIRLLQYWRGSLKDMNRDYSEFSDDELTKMIQDLESRILKGQDREAKQIKNEYDAFIERNVDKPKIDFIDVRTEESINRNYKDDNTRVNFRRQGIALAMYQEGAKWMDSMGLRLYASTLQQPEAEAAWKKMDSLGWVKRDGKRLYLDPQKIPENS